MSQYGKYPQPKTSILQTNRLLEFIEYTNRRQSKMLQEILKKAGATQEVIDSVDIDKQREIWKKEFEEGKREAGEILEKIRKQNETMLVPIQEGNTIRFETRKVTAEERMQALMNMAEIVKALKNGDAHVLPQSKNQ